MTEKKHRKVSVKKMSLFNFKKDSETESTPNLENLLKNYSIEVMPRTAEKIESFSNLLPKGTRVYIAHIEGTPIEDMIKTAVRLTDANYEVMPHFPARIIKNKKMLSDWINRYRDEANVDQALVLAGGIPNAIGDFDSSIQLIETGLFDKAGFKRIHFAGHPEGNKDIDPDGTFNNVNQALEWKQNYSDQTSATVCLTTQFSFDAKPILKWTSDLTDMGITLPVHIGVAGPAKLQTLLKFAIECGVGASLGVLKKRARDITKLLLPYEPTEFLNQLEIERLHQSSFNIEQVHFFPLGGIKTNALWVSDNGGKSGIPAVSKN